MSSHDELAAPVDTCFKSHHLTLEHFCPSLLCAGIAEVGVGLSITMTREVLDTACDASIFQPLQIAHNHWGCNLWLIRKRTVANDNIIWVSVHVSHRSEVDIEPILREIVADDITCMVGFCRITRLANLSHRANNFHIEVLIVCDAGNTSSLFIDAQQRFTV